jgi:hypothetical protein
MRLQPRPPDYADTTTVVAATTTTTIGTRKMDSLKPASD